jgi:hypothetical protein
MARAASPPTWAHSDEDDGQPIQQQSQSHQQRQHRPQPKTTTILFFLRQRAATARPLALAAAAVGLLPLLLIGSLLLFRPRAPSPEQLLATVNQPYYQARLRPLALSLGPRHPIAARRPPHALFADVHLTPPRLAPRSAADGGSVSDRLSALLAASDGLNISSVPTDAAAYELFVGVTDEWWEEVEEEAQGGVGPTPATPRKKTRVQRSRQRQQRLACVDAARRLLPEPFHASMIVRNRTIPTSWAAGDEEEEDDEKARPRRRQPQHPHPTKLSPALWRWDPETITREAFDSIPYFLGGDDCRLCYDVLRYKVFSGRLYRRTADCARDILSSNASALPLPPGQTRCPDDWARGKGVEEVMLVATWLYRLPDADLAVHRGDGAAAGFPVLQHNIRRDHPLAGFTIPYPEHWTFGVMSARQLVGWAACTRARYGLVAATRGEKGQGGATSPNASSNSSAVADPSSCSRTPLIPRAVWRGTTTDPYRGAWLHQFFGMSRARLHALSLVHADVLDARISAVRQMDEEGVPQMAADKASGQRLLSLPSEVAWPPNSEAVAWASGGEALAGRAAAARLADCGGGGGGEQETNDDDDDDTNPYDPRPPVYLAMEDYNRYAAVLDVDGNGWSSRLLSLLSGASARPVLKQSTPLAAGYEHLFAPGKHLVHFRGDLRDADDVARRWVGLVVGGGAEAEEGREAARRRGRKTPRRQEQGHKAATCTAEDDDDDQGAHPSTPEDADAMAREAAALASLALNRWALVESAAASMEAYAERLAWKVEAPKAEDGWELVPFSACCQFGQLPPEFLEAMKVGGD